MDFVYENIELICKIGIGIGAFVTIISIIFGCIIVAKGGDFFTAARLISIIGGILIIGLSILGLYKANN